MYLTLYRKYRPRLFSQVIGQDIAVKIITNSIIKNSFSHAYLFAGTRGTGKTTVARIFAKALNCLNKQGAEPCDTCANCISMNQGSFPDCIEIDAASNRGINEIKQIRENLKLVPLKGKYKIYIIDEVHMLTMEAFNALLKSLEEPPNFVVFILATTDIHKVPITIQSRCQKIEFKRVHHKIIFEHLKNICAKEGINIENEALMYLSKSANGSVRDSLSLLEQVRNLDDNIKLSSILEMFSIFSFHWVYDYITFVINGEIKNLIDLLNKIKYHSVNLHQFLYTLIDEIKNCIYYGYTSDDGEYSSFQIEYYKKILSNVDIQKLIKILGLLQNMTFQYKNDNDYILFEINSLRMAFEFSKTNIDNPKSFDNLTKDKDGNQEYTSKEKVKENEKVFNKEKQDLDESKQDLDRTEEIFSQEEGLEKQNIKLNENLKEKVLKVFEGDKLLYKVIKNSQRVYVDDSKLIFIFQVEKKADITYKKIIEQKASYILQKIKNILNVSFIEVKELKNEKTSKVTKNSLIDRIIDYTEKI